MGWKEEYRDTLRDLKMNSKPQINLLTMMAEDYIGDVAKAKEIVGVIEKHLAQVPGNFKLPVLYLIDSIIKNVGKIYPSLFEVNIVSTFFGVFEKVDDRTKTQMFKLRQTWSGVFQARKLYEIDVRCNTCDKKWPICAQPPNNSNRIHVNPKFLNTPKPPATPAAPAPPVNVPATPESDDPELKARLLQKQKELFELQMKKVELEIQQMQTKNTRDATKLSIQLNSTTNAVEETKKHEKKLLDQVEKAKSKTNIVNQLLSSLPSSSHNHKNVTVASAIVVPSKSSDSSTKTVSSKKEKEEKDKVKDPREKGKSKEREKDKMKEKEKDKDMRSSSKDIKPKQENSKSSSSSPKKSSKSSSSSSTDGRDDRSRSTSKKHSKGSDNDSTVSAKPDKDKSDSKRSKDRDRRSSSRGRESKDKRSSNKSSDSDKSPKKSRSPVKNEDRETFDARRTAVLKRSYRKNVNAGEEENNVPQKALEQFDTASSSDVDLRFQGRKETEPPEKKPRPGSAIVDLFGNEDVDLRQSGNVSWTQVKREKSEEGPEGHREVLQQQNHNRPQPTPSPAGSQKEGCDPLGRPLLYNKLPDDPEERKRSLDFKAQVVNPLEVFRREYIDTALNDKGELSPVAVKNIMAKAQELLNPEHYISLMKQIQQINETSAMREVQQRQQIRAGNNNNWQPDQSDSVNSWNVAATTGGSAGPWSVGFQPRGPSDTAMPRFPPGPQGIWAPAPVMGLPTPWNTPLPRPAGPNPFEEALKVADDLIPPVNETELRVAERDNVSSIPIDKVMRQVRFYGETAVILMGRMGDDPRQISFKPDNQSRTVLVDGKPMEIMISEIKRFELNRKYHSVKLGAPTRELYIDDRHYEAFFGGPAIRIPLGHQMHSFELVGQPPEVEIAKVPRHDLIAGKVTLMIDAAPFTVFLDEKPQKIDVFRKPVVLRFCEGFNKVLLNGRPFSTNFGNRLPFTITIQNDGQHYLRFSALPPSTLKAMSHFIRARQDHADGPELIGRGRGRGMNRRGGRGGLRVGRDMIEPRLPNVTDQNPLDMLNFFSTPQPAPSPDEMRGRQTRLSFQAYESEMKEDISDTKEDSNDASNGLPDVSNILALAAKLGFLPSAKENTEKEQKSKVDEEAKEETAKDETKEKADKEEKEEEAPPIEPLPTVDVFLNEKNWGSQRRDVLINQLWTGVQCASCGLRFPPHQTVRYSQHLDWHFRRNRREKANAKKAKSRAWYYVLSDWIQFEEVEDLEERAANLFETQEEDDNEVRSPTAEVNPEEFTVLASGHEGATCPLCGEGFESYFDEDKEEWRLKDAVLEESEGGRVFHYICHQDFLTSSVEETEPMEVEQPQTVVVDLQEPPQNEEVVPPETEREKTSDEEISSVPAAPEDPETEEEDDEVLILKEGKKEVVLMELDLVDEDGTAEVNSQDVSDDSKNKIESNGSPRTESSNREEIVNSNNISSENRSIMSPVVINDESSSNSLLPGITEDSSGGVFGFALGIRRERSESPEPLEEKKIVYESMVFDFPKIKIEPPDDDVREGQPDLETAPPVPVIEDEDVGMGEQPSLPPPPQFNPVMVMDPIDLTMDDDDSMDTGNIRQGLHQMTSIDGNLHVEEHINIPIPTQNKIRINIAGLDMSGKSPKSPGKSPHSNSEENKSTSTPPTVEETKSPAEPKSPENSDNAELVFTEELKRLKPRLVGRKLVSYPPRPGKTEESGLCVIS